MITAITTAIENKAGAEAVIGATTTVIAEATIETPDIEAEVGVEIDIIDSEEDNTIVHHLALLKGRKNELLAMMIHVIDTEMITVEIEETSTEKNNKK